MKTINNTQTGKLQFSTPITVTDFTKPTQEMLQAINMVKVKAARADYVSKIIVQVDDLKFDGDEASQDRMARAIVALDEGETIQWVLADNSIVHVTREQLRQALRLAGQAQTEVWANPYIKEEINSINWE